MTEQRDLFSRLNDATPSRAAELSVWMLSAPSRKALWQALSDAGIPVGGLTGFYRTLRDQTPERMPDWLLSRATPAQIEQVLATRFAARLPRYAVTTLAAQFYCEMQVHLDHAHDVRIVSPARTEGVRNHAVIEAEAEVIPPEKLKALLDAGEQVGLAEYPLSLELDGMALAGRADYVEVRKTQSLIVLEYKFSSRTELFPGHVAQVLMYGEMLDAAGFLSTDLKHVVAMLPRGERPSERLASTLARVARETELPLHAGSITNTGTSTQTPALTQGLAVHSTQVAGATVHMFRHDAPRARALVQWAASYWKRTRLPLANGSPGKCRACAFNAAGLCADAVAPTDGRWVHRTEQDADGSTRHLVFPA